MVEVVGQPKRYGDTAAVDDQSFTVEPGQVTGFLGPNGSGNSTTIRMIVDFDAPTSGHVTVGGRSYGSLHFPFARGEAGALLDANAAHPGRRARNHLNWLADSNGIPRRRVDEVLGIVGLTEAAHRWASALPEDLLVLAARPRRQGGQPGAVATSGRAGRAQVKACRSDLRLCPGNTRWRSVEMNGQL